MPAAAALAAGAFDDAELPALLPDEVDVDADAPFFEAGVLAEEAGQ